MRSLIFAALALVGFVGEAQAYLDPGTGSVLLQALIGSIAAGLVAGKLYWHRLKGFFSKGRREAASPNEQSSRKPLN